MKVKAIILGSLLFQCFLLSTMASIECSLFADPNDYIDDPNNLENGLFECGDPNLTEYDFTPPIYWKRVPHPDSEILNGPEPIDCYAALRHEFDPNTSRIDWDISAPYQKDSFVLLTTGHPDMENGDTDDIKGSLISQKLYLNPGDVILGAYFFGTSDYRPYNDYASIYLEPVDLSNEPNTPIVLAECDVLTVGNYESTLGLSPNTGGWISFSYAVEPNQTGPYLLYCEVTDYTDQAFDSYFAVDGLRICRGGKPTADLDSDCDVDLQDFSFISIAWMEFCPDPRIDDPNFPGDPNDYPSPPTDPNILPICELADLDKSWYVDPNDLGIMSSQWLNNLPSE